MKAKLLNKSENLINFNEVKDIENKEVKENKSKNKFTLDLFYDFLFSLKIMNVIFIVTFQINNTLIKRGIKDYFQKIFLEKELLIMHHEK